MWAYKIASVFCNFLFKIRFRVTFEGMENLPKKGPYMVISNHRSNLDPIFLSHKIKPWVHFMGKIELFENPWIGWICYLIGGYPVTRGAGDSSAIDASVGYIQKGECVGVFPEGTRSKDGVLGRPKSGAALIARMAQADILPCCIEFEGKLKAGTHVTIRYGKLIPYEELGFVSDSPRELKAATKVMFGAVEALLGVQEEKDA